MQTHANREDSHANRAEAQGVNATNQFADQRPAAASQNRLAGLADSSPRATQLRTLQAMANASPGVETTRRLGIAQTATAQRQAVEEEEPLQGKFAITQREEMDDEEPLQGKFATAQRAAAEEDEVQMKTIGAPEPAAQLQAKAAPHKNETGLPDNLKSGIESLSGMSMDNVRVHYNSSKPAQLNAYAYAQGTDIHVGPGQEKHLPHEAWHVVQQAQGRVRPTMQMKGGVAVNDDAGLEGEADLMGKRALYLLTGGPSPINNISKNTCIKENGKTAQRALQDKIEEAKKTPSDKSTIVQKGQDLHYKSTRDMGIKSTTGNTSKTYRSINTYKQVIASEGYVVIDPDDPINGENIEEKNAAITDNKGGSLPHHDQNIYSDLAYKPNGAHLTRCHAISYRYGGKVTPENIFPQTSDFNNNHLICCEGVFKNQIVMAKRHNEKNSTDKIRAVMAYEITVPNPLTPNECENNIKFDYDSLFIDKHGTEKKVLKTVSSAISFDDELDQMGFKHTGKKLHHGSEIEDINTDSSNHEASLYADEIHTSLKEAIKKAIKFNKNTTKGNKSPQNISKTADALDLILPNYNDTVSGVDKFKGIWKCMEMLYKTLSDCPHFIGKDFPKRSQYNFQDYIYTRTKKID